ncbi:MAG: methyl-accepting chemotaxis protein [Spirochaetales bacterium]|jgi:hypothetical protein|nr:methyl-accepting chemotaxis protein [Spirochaetales bacterium]
MKLKTLRLLQALGGLPGWIPLILLPRLESGLLRGAACTAAGLWFILLWRLTLRGSRKFRSQAQDLTRWEGEDLAAEEEEQNRRTEADRREGAAQREELSRLCARALAELPLWEKKLETYGNLAQTLRDAAGKIDELSQARDFPALLRETAAYCALVPLLREDWEGRLAQTLSQAKASPPQTSSPDNPGLPERPPEALRETRKTAEEIRQAADRVGEMAARMTFVAINAAIEAAHAGTGGRGFAVLAQEIQGMAERDAENSRRLKEVIGELSEPAAESPSLGGLPPDPNPAPSKEGESVEGADLSFPEAICRRVLGLLEETEANRKALQEAAQALTPPSPGGVGFPALSAALGQCREALENWERRLKNLEDLAQRPL